MRLSVLISFVILIAVICVASAINSGSVPGITSNLILPDKPTSGVQSGIVSSPAAISTPNACKTCTQSEENSATLSANGFKSEDKISKAVELSNIKKINAENKELGFDWVAGETSVSGLTPEAYKKLLGGIPMTGTDNLDTVKTNNVQAYPTYFNWKSYSGKDWTTSPKNQANCGACWAFATTGMVEAYWKMYQKMNTWYPDFAEQYFLSCNIYGYSCAGGNQQVLNHLTTVNDAKGGRGIVYDSYYPYVQAKTSCKSLSGYSRWKLPTGRSWKWLFGMQSTSTLMEKIAGYGPIAVGIYADNKFLAYKSGIFDTSSTYSGMNHLVLLTGWGYNNGRLYWIAKNSWGTGWGESGWFRIYAGKLNVGFQPAWITPGPWYVGKSNSATGFEVGTAS